MPYILFSPVGKTDPITNYHDGSLIHICRKYKPCKVYLYLSQEMLNFHRLDNRYCKCLEWLQEKVHFKCEIVLLERPDLVDVQVFDRFYDEFEQEVQKIQQANPDDTILFNVSSGTPAMKSALQFLAAASENMYVPVQVSTPQQGVNREQYVFEQYDLETRWELNEDNIEPFKDRCVESATATLNKRIKLEVIAKHIEACDYQAAWRVAQSIEKLLTAETMALLEGAAKRVVLDIKGAEAAFVKADAPLMPLMSSDRRLVVEYLLWLQIKQQRGDLADFVRGLTPVFVDLFSLALKEKCRIDVSTYCVANKQGVLRLSRSKLQKHNPDLLRSLDGQFGGDFQDKTELSAHLLVAILKKECQDEKLVQMAEDLRRVEREARNPVAHDIVSVTEEWLNNRVKCDSHKIMKLLKDFTQRSCSGIPPAIWESYDAMNKAIVMALNKPIAKE